MTGVEDAGDAAHADHRTRWVRDLCAAAAESGNPLLYFKALHSLIFDALLGAIQHAMLSGLDENESVRQAVASDLCIRLPPEMHRYLLWAAKRIDVLARGEDFRLPRNAQREERLPADAAARLVTRALGITRPGFNAFKLSQTRDLGMWARDEEAAERGRGATALDARYAAMQRLGYRDERSFRRVKTGKPRSRRGKPPG